MSKAYAKAYAKKMKKETAPKKAQSPSVSQTQTQTKNKGYDYIDSRSNLTAQQKAQAKANIDRIEARRKRLAERKANAPEEKAYMQRQKSGIMTADDYRKAKESNEQRKETAKRVATNTGRAIKKGATDAVSGYGQSILDVDEMVKSDKNWTAAKAQKMGIDRNDTKKMAEIEQSRKETLKKDREDRLNLARKQEERQKKFDEQTKNASGLEKAWYGAAESGTGMLIDTAIGAATGSGQFGALASMGLRTYGTTRGQAEKEGATEKEDRLYALAQAGKEVGTELMFPGAGLARKAYGRAGLDLADKTALALTKGLTGKKADVVSAGVKLLGGTAEENAEELAGWGLDPLLKETIYGKNVRQRMADTLKSNLPEITSKEDADRVASYFSTSQFADDLKKEYVSSGMSQEDASKLADQMRDYYVAYYSGDEKTFNDLEDKLTRELTGTGLKGSWSMDELKDTLASTTLLTMATGLPGAVTTSVRGNAIFDSDEVREVFGDNAVNVVADAVKNVSDPKLSIKAEAYKKRLDEGKDLTGTQKYELYQGYLEKVKATAEKKQASESVIVNESRKNNYVPTVMGVTPDGQQVYAKETQMAYNEKYASTSLTTEAYMKYMDSDGSISQDESARADAVNKAVADLHVGGLTVGDTHEFAYGNTLAREVLKEEEGIDLNDYVVRDSKGNVDLAATNEATENALFELNAKNALAMAKTETDVYIDDTRGSIDADLLTRFGNSGQAVWKSINKDLDPRDLNTYLTHANADSYFYAAGRNTDMSVDEAVEKYGDTFKSVSNAELKRAFAAGQRDRIIANTPGYGQTVTAGSNIKLKKTEPILSGQLIMDDDAKAMIPDSVQSEYLALAEATGANIHLVSDLSPVDKDGNPIVNKRTGKAVQLNGMSKGNDIWLNVNTAAEQNLGYVFMHEMTHQIKQYAPNEYMALENLVRDKWFNKDYGQMQRMIKERIDLYKTKGGQSLTEEEALEEIIADAMAEAIDDPNFAAEVCETNEAVGQQILNAIKSALRSIRNMFARDEFRNENFHNALLSYLGILDDAEKMWLEALAVAKQNKANGLIADWQDKANKQNSPRLSMGDDMIIEGKTAKWTDKRIDRLLNQYGGDDDYSAAYAVMMSPRDFLTLTLDNKYLEKWNETAENLPEELKSMSYDEMREYVRAKGRETGEWINPELLHPLDESELENEWQTPFLIIKSSQGAAGRINKIKGHEGRHRMRALMEAGVESVPVVIEDPDTKYSKEHLGFMLFNPQSFYGEQTNEGESVWVEDLVPIKDSNRQELVEKFGGEADVRFSVSEDTIEALNEDGVDITESGSAVKYSLYSWQDTDIEELKNKLRSAGFDEKRIEKWIKDVNSIAALISADMTRLNYTADQFQDALKPNSEYYFTLDLSTLCQKRRLYQGTYNKIMRYLVNNVLMPEDTVRLRAMMDEMGYEVPCGICYEESRKKNEGKFAERWLNGYGKKWKGYKNQEHNDPYIPTLYEVTTTEGREKLREEHPEAYESYVNYQKTRGSANPKISYTHTDYRGDILRMTESDIAKVLHIGGLRIQSFSDFEIPHVIDMMQAVMDMAAQNLTAQAYTKVPAFAKIFGGTGIKINLSLIQKVDAEGNPVYDEKGRLVFDSKEGIDPEEAFALREKYSQNVGTILVGTSNQQILDAWADPRVDMVIPFHRSGWSKKEFEKLGLIGYKDFTKGQTERYMMGKKDMALSTASKALGLTKDEKLQPIYSADYWDNNLSGKENAERYLALCAEKHYRPVFYQFLHDNGDGTWSLQEDGSTDGYWKSLIDFKMYDNDGDFAPQEEVQPVFDMEEANKIMGEYEGGADTLPVADDVVEEFLKEYKENHPNAKIDINDNAKLSIAVDLDDDYMEAVNSGDMDKAQSFVDEAAKMAGYNSPLLYHGTYESFNVFKPNEFLTEINGDSQIKGYFSEDKSYAENYGTPGNYYVRINNPLDFYDLPFDQTKEAWINWFESKGVTDIQFDSSLEEDTLKGAHWEDGSTTYSPWEIFDGSDLWAGDGNITERIAAAGYDGMRWDYDEKAWIPFDDTAIKSADTVTYAEDGSVIPLSERFDPNNDDIRYSMPTQDSEGRVLSDGQMEYFANSQARGLGGRLAVVYHSTRNGGFTIFDPSYSEDRRSIFFTDSLDMSQSYSGGGEEFDVTNFGLPKIEPNSIYDVKDVVDYFNSIPKGAKGQLELRLYVPESEDSETYASWADSEYWSGAGTLQEFLDKYGADYKNVEGYFEDKDGYTIGEFFDSDDLCNELEACVKYINENSGGTSGQGETGTYACYLNLENPLIIECNGANWDSIREPDFETIQVSIIEKEGGEFAYRVLNNGSLTDIEYFNSLDELRETLGDGFADQVEELDERILRLGYGAELFTWQGEAFDPEEEGHWPMEGNTGFWCNEAEAMGYDGVIFRDLQDYGQYSRGYGSGGDVYVAFSSEQIKDINNENPTENPDIRYSIPDRQEALDTMIVGADSIERIPLRDTKLEEQRVKYSLSVKDFENMVISGWDEHYRTFGRLLDDESVKPHLISMMSQIMKESETGRQYKAETLDETIKDMKVMYFEMKKGMSKEFADRAWAAAERIVNDVDYNDDLYVEYKGMRDYLSKRWIQIPEALMYDEDFAEYMRDNSGRMRFRENGSGVEAVYKYLRKKYPKIFTEDLDDPVDMLLQMDYVLDLTSPYRDAYTSEEYTDLVRDVAESLCEMVRQGEEYRSVADDLYEKFDAKSKAMKQRHNEAKQKIRDQYGEKIASLRQEKKEAVENVRQEEKEKRQRQSDRANKWKEKYQQRIQHDKEVREAKKEKKMHRALYDAVLNEYNDLTKRLLKPSKDKAKNIPEQLRQPLAEMLYVFDLEKERSKELEEMYRIPTRTQLNLRQMKDSLEKVIQENETAYEFSDIHKFLKGKMTEIADKMDMLGDHSIDALDNNDIAVIKDLMKGLNSAIKNYQQFEIDGEKYEAQQIADKVGEGAKEHESLYGKGKKYTGARAFVDNIVNMGELTPIYFFRQIKGMYDMYRQIRKGFDSYVRNEKVIIDKIAKILAPYYKTNRKGQQVQGSEIEDWRHLESAETFNTTYGSLTLTIAQRMSLYCLYKRDQARNHMLSDRGGVVASEITAGSKMHKAEEMLKGKVVEYKQTPLTPEDVENIIATLTPEQIKIADNLQELMSNDMSKLGNQASVKLTGIEMYKETEYFPIKIQAESKGKDLDNIGMQEKVRNPGFSNPLQDHASNPIILDDIFTAVASHCNEMNLYASYAVPLTSFMKVYNGSVLDENGDAVKVQTVIKQTYGEKAIQYIDNFLDDINGNSFKRHGGLDDVLDKALGQAKKASVFANLRVALQQPTAILRAFAVMHPKYFAGVKPSRKATQEMFEHCPIAQWKSWGYYDTHFGRDIEDVMMGANVSSKMDVIMSDIYGEFDNMTWGMIWQAVKKEVKAENPNVDEGTQEFWDLCSERASYVFDMTQVVDSPFHRSNDMRSKNGLVKQLTSFQSEPTLSFNVLRQGFVDAYEEYKKGNKAKAEKALARVLAVWTAQAVTVAIAQSFVDALRRKGADDDEDPNFLALWWQNFMADFVDDINPINNVYYFKEIVPPILNALTGQYVFGQQNLTFQWVDTLTKGIQKCKKKWEKGSAYKTSWYDCLTDLFGGVGYLAGIPVKTMMRGVKNAVHWFNKITGAEVFADDGSVDKAVDSMVDRFRKEKGDTETSDEEDEAEGLSKKDAKKIFKSGIKAGLKAIPKTEEQMLKEIEEKTVGLYGEDRERKIWNIVGEGYKDHIEKGDYAYIRKIRGVIERAGGDVNSFDKKVLDASRSAFKKSLVSDPTDAQIMQQQNIRSYLLEHGMSEEEISSELIYKSQTARDLKAAFRMGNENYIVDELVTLLRAGVTRDDIYKLYKYRNYGAKDYDGKYSSPEYTKTTGQFIWPTDGVITSHFGYRDAPTAGASSNHPAIDIGASQGTPVVAADGGVVISAGANGGYGNSVGIKHANGMVTWYNHLYGWNVKVGDEVGQGQQIGQVGSTGISTGPHLDFKILDADGNPVDPEQYLNARS